VSTPTHPDPRAPNLPRSRGDRYNEELLDLLQRYEAIKGYLNGRVSKSSDPVTVRELLSYLDYITGFMDRLTEIIEGVEGDVGDPTATT